MTNGARGSSSSNGRAGSPTPERNEFVLLSDVMGLSSLVDMINSVPGATSSSVLGPFHVSNPPPLEIGGDMKRDFEGEVVLVEGIVRDIDGNPVAGAEIDIWQTAPNGHVFQPGPGAGHPFVPRADDHGRERPLRLHHGAAR